MWPHLWAPTVTPLTYWKHPSFRSTVLGSVPGWGRQGWVGIIRGEGIPLARVGLPMCGGRTLAMDSSVSPRPRRAWGFPQSTWLRKQASTAMDLPKQSGVEEKGAPSGDFSPKADVRRLGSGGCQRERP